jgi:hypothetical protein
LKILEYKLKDIQIQNLFQINNNKTKEMHRKNRSVKKKITKKTVELLLASSSHGLPNVFRSKRIIMKIMWLSLFIISTSFGIYTVFEIVNNYLKHEVVTKIDVITEVPTECKL